MELKQSNIVESPDRKGWARLAAQVAHAHTTSASDTLWFDVPEKYAQFLSTSGNPWLACLLPLAVTLGQPLRVHLPTDRVLFENAHELARIWTSWYPNLRAVPIEAEVHKSNERPQPVKTAAFFSGGVDSFFTVIRHDSPTGFVGQTRVDDLLLVWGFDIRLQSSDAFSRMRDVLQRAASDLGKELVPVATNVGAKLMRHTNWGLLSHGCALASIALAMEQRYGRVLVASSHGYRDLQPWGSHPLTDPLLSTSRTKIVHDGAGFSRPQKTHFLTRSEVAMRSLHVCWLLHSEKNCGACNKCYRTMITLALLGALDRCTTFPEGSFDERKIPTIYSRDWSDRALLREVRDLAIRKARLDIAKAIDRSFKHSSRYDKWLPVITWLETNRLGWILQIARKLYRIRLNLFSPVAQRTTNRAAGMG